MSIWSFDGLQSSGAAGEGKYDDTCIRFHSVGESGLASPRSSQGLSIGVGSAPPGTKSLESSVFMAFWGASVFGAGAEIPTALELPPQDGSKAEIRNAAEDCSTMVVFEFIDWGLLLVLFP